MVIYAAEVHALVEKHEREWYCDKPHLWDQILVFWTGVSRYQIWEEGEDALKVNSNQRTEKNAHLLCANKHQERILAVFREFKCLCLVKKLLGECASFCEVLAHYVPEYHKERLREMI